MRTHALLTRAAVLVAAAVAVLLTTALPAAAFQADPLRFMRDPHVHGERIAFAYQGDIWLANVDGSGARRLTTHLGNEFSPRFSPDGRRIAFSANWMGNDDVYVVPVEGGEPSQLTWFTGGDDVLYWTPEGDGILVSSSRSADPWGSPLYIVPLDGSIPTPMAMDWGSAGMIRQDGGAVAFTRQGVSTSRKGYRGNRSAEIWVQDLGTEEIRQLTDLDLQDFREHVNDGLPMWGRDGRIYYMSERDGIFNIWSIAADGSDMTQVTRFREGGVRYPSISPDGSRIVFEQDFDLWMLDVPGGEPQRLMIEAPVDLRGNVVEWADADGSTDGFSPSPEGDFVAVDFRGEIVIVPSEEGIGEMTRVTDSPWRERSQSWSPDGRWIVYVSDESLEEELWLYDVDTGERRKLTEHESTKSDILWSPTSDRFAFEAANTIFEVRVPDGTVRELAENPAGGYSLDAYSADGAWLVYSRRGHDRNSEVYLYEVGSGAEHNVTDSPFTERSGNLTPDGSTVLFVSDRDGTNHLYAVSLTRLTEDPDDPLVRLRERRERDQRRREGADSAATVSITVELDGIGERARQLTTGSDGVGSYFLSEDGRTVYFTSSDDEGAGLFSIGVDGRNQRKVTSGSFPGLTPTSERTHVFYRQGGFGGGQVWRMALSNQRKERVEFDFPVKVDHRADWEQIFEEAWRVMKYRFYDPEMHGRDWDAIKAEYKPVLAQVGAYEDVYDLANKMIGELNASHVGVSGSPSRPMPDAYQSRHLGFEMEPAGGRYRVTHIYRDGPADKEWLDLEVGDYVLSLDGTEVNAGDNYWRVLNHLLNDYATVRVADSPSGQNARDLRIRTVGSARNLQYEEWVQKNRDFVDQESDGRIAYVHIRSMNQSSLRRFETEIEQFWDKEGIVVDIRFNGGGNIDQELIDILERRPYQFWNSRWGSRAWGRRPYYAIAGPKVMLINHRSGSDSEVTPLGFRDLGLGRIVGNPTAAAVIATGSYGLINGGSIRTPGSLVVQWDPTQPYNFGVNLENYGVPPDVWVENTPADNLRGYDRELKAAVDEALRMAEEGNWQYRVTEPGSRGMDGGSRGGSGGAVRPAGSGPGGGSGGVPSGPSR